VRDRQTGMLTTASTLLTCCKNNAPVLKKLLIRKVDCCECFRSRTGPESAHSPHILTRACQDVLENKEKPTDAGVKAQNPLALIYCIAYLLYSKSCNNLYN